MKSLKTFSLLAVSMSVIAMSAAENNNKPMITDGVADLEQYLLGDVDRNGQTILHRIAGNCDNDDFAVRLKLFDFLENAPQSESVRALSTKMVVLGSLPEDVATLVVVTDMLNFIQRKDNNGETALDIAKKRNALNPHKRCNVCVELLEKCAELDKDLMKTLFK